MLNELPQNDQRKILRLLCEDKFNDIFMCLTLLCVKKLFLSIIVNISEFSIPVLITLLTSGVDIQNLVSQLSFNTKTLFSAIAYILYFIVFYLKYIRNCSYIASLFYIIIQQLIVHYTCHISLYSTNSIDYYLIAGLLSLEGIIFDYSDYIKRAAKRSL